MIRHVEEHGPATETNRSEQQLFSAGPISGDKWPDLIGAVTLRLTTNPTSETRACVPARASRSRIRKGRSAPKARACRAHTQRR